MKLGISSYCFPWSAGIEYFGRTKPFTPQTLLAYAVDHQVPVIQFGDNLPLHHQSHVSLDRLKKEADAAGVQIETGTRGLKKDHVLSYLAIAKQLGSGFLRLVIDDTGFHPDEAEVILRIRELLPALKENGILLALENHDRFPALSLERIVLQTDPVWVGICLDTANSFGAGEGIAELIRVLAPYTVNLHLKDIVITRLAHKMGFRVEGCPAGEGILDIPFILAQLEKTRRCQSATLEVWSDPEETIEATLAKEKEWVERSLIYLKTVLP